MSESLQVACIVTMPLEENTFVAWLEGRRDCVVVDPGLEPQKIVRFLNEQALQPVAMLITHGHGDHIGGIRDLRETWPDCPIVIGAEDAPKLTDPVENMSASFGVPITSPPADVLLREGDMYEAAGMSFDVREIPGHSIGHVVYLCRHTPLYVFGGDVLFAGSVGRCDLPRGSFKKLAEGIRNKLYTLPDETIVLPGHGPATTIGEEKRSNPFVKG